MSASGRRDGGAPALGAIAALLAALTACGQAEPDCVMPPCPLPLALTLTVATAEGGPVAGASVQVSGSMSGSVPCGVEGSTTLCRVMGTAGRYDLRVSADGFQTATRSVVVEGSNPPCACPTVQSQQLTVVLAPS